MGERLTLARNIYQDAHGIEILVQRKGVPARARFPLGTPLHELADTRDVMIDTLRTGRAKTSPAGTLAADVARCLATLPAGSANRRDVENLLGHWLDAPVDSDGEASTFGAQPRATLTAMAIKTQLAVFRAARRPNGRPRFSPKTVKELLRLLGWVYTTIDGPDARNPVRAVKAPRVRYDDPRGIDYDVIERIFAEVPDRGRPVKGETRPTLSLTKIRLAVMAYTGMHQIEVGRLVARDVDLKGRRVWIGPRIKGAGSHGAWHRLTDRGVTALAAFVAAQAFGPFDTRSMARTWNIALGKAKTAWEAETDAPWPVHEGARPYDLRHSMGTAVYMATGDIRAAQAILRHRQGSTTERYTRAGVSRQVDAAIGKLDAAFAGLPKTAPKQAGPNVPKRPPMSQASGPAPRTRRAKR